MESRPLEFPATQERRYSCSSGRIFSSDPKIVSPIHTILPTTHETKEQEKPDWRLLFGFWTELDALYHAYPPPAKPRCPTLPFDSPPEWKKRLVPDHVDGFLSNPAAAACLHTVASCMETDTAASFTNFIISGGEYCGKSAFAGLLRDTLLSINPELPCQFSTINASDTPSDKIFQSKLDDAVKRLDASKAAGSVCFLTIERFESVPPSTQQHFFVPLLAVANRKNVFVILLVRPDASKLAEQIKTVSTMVHLTPLTANLVRTKLLLICRQERIGYTREGLEELGKRCSFKLLECMEKLHQVFLKHYYISLPNALKSYEDSNSSAPSTNSYFLTAPPFPLSVVRMNEPLRHCPKCTLVPPCSHIPLEKLYSKVEHIRSLYPGNGRAPDTAKKSSTPPSTGQQLCPSFRRRGVCTNIQKLGRCRYAHPLDIHTIDTAAVVPRCRIHTLPLPCLHCTNAEQLKTEARKEFAVCEKLRREVLRSRQVMADLETQRFMFDRDRGRSVKWGGAKKAADEQLAHLDEKLNQAKSKLHHQEQELSSHQDAHDKLQDGAARGRSFGLGKGNGRIEVMQVDKQHPKGVAAV